MEKINSKNDVYTLLAAPAAAAALGAAIETGLLWLLAEKPLPAVQVADALHLPVRRCQYWLQYLESLGVVQKTPDGYTPTPGCNEAILGTDSQASWRHLALDERERTAGLHDLSLYIQAPGSIWAAQGLAEPPDYVEKMRQDPDRAREFTRTLYELHQNLGSQIAGCLDLTHVSRLMDPGGGSGVISMALLRRYPHLTAVVIDQENVCAAGREIAAENGFSSRLSYIAADLLKDDLPTGFDMVVECDVSIYEVEFYRKLHASLKPGGRLAVVDQFSPAEDCLPASRLEWVFLDSLKNPDITIPTVAQFRAILSLAGFTPLPGEHMLNNRWDVIQARK